MIYAPYPSPDETIYAKAKKREKIYHLHLQQNQLSGQIALLQGEQYEFNIIRILEEYAYKRHDIELEYARDIEDLQRDKAEYSIKLIKHQAAVWATIEEEQIAQKQSGG